MFKFVVLVGIFLNVRGGYKDEIFGIVRLEYVNSKSLEKVNQVLSGIAESLRSSQDADDRMNKTRQAECTAEITFLDRPIEVMYSEITRAKQIVAEKEPKFNRTQSQILEKNLIITYLTQTLSSLDRIYKEDCEYLQDSYLEHEDALSAVTSSLSLLKKSEISVTSSKIHDNSEHTEIVGLSFLQTDQESFSRLVDICTDVFKNLKESLKANAAKKVEIDMEYTEVRGVVERVKAQVEEIRDNLDAESLDMAEDIEEANRMLREAQEECGSMVRAKHDKETECGAWTRQYAYETGKRNEEMKAILEITQMANQDISYLEKVI